MKNLFILLFSVYSIQAFSQTKQWELVKNENGIKIYSRQASNDRALKELNVVAEVKASLSTIITIFNDKASFPKWVYGCGSAQMLDIVSDMETYHYQTTDMPWPVQNRDLILHTVIAQDPVTKVITIDCTGTPDYKPVNTNFIRITHYKAFWVLTPKPNGIVEINYTINFDPGGSLPDWVVNMVSTEGPMKTMMGLQNRLADYKNAKLSYITD